MNADLVDCKSYLLEITDTAVCGFCEHTYVLSVEGHQNILCYHCQTVYISVRDKLRARGLRGYAVRDFLEDRKRRSYGEWQLRAQEQFPAAG